MWLLPRSLYPKPRGPRVLPVGELVLWYGMFAPCGRLLGTMGFAHGAPLRNGKKIYNPLCQWQGFLTR